MFEMKYYYYGLYVLLLFGLFHFSEGKPCPERTRPHKTRCDAYYKCVELLGDKHVWVPSNCEQGLIYEHTLAVCVLPADDWECLLGDHKTSTNSNTTNHQALSKKEADIYIISNVDNEDDIVNKKYDVDDGKVEIIIGTELNGKNKEGDDIESLYDGSGNGGGLVELDGFIPAQNREAENDNFSASKVLEEGEKNMDYKKGVQKIEQKEALQEILQTIKMKAEIGQPSANIDPKLTTHLQRLSQLINGLKQAYQTSDDKLNEQESLGPDQLNAFLAHFNIKNKFDTLDPYSYTSSTSTTTPNPNSTFYYQHEFSSKLIPETKIFLSNMLPHRYGSNNHDNSNSGVDYSNSQIVVNRPEGSVLFSIPAEHHFVEHPEYYSDNTPKISEGTLKTVLELSKQMIAQQNIPKVIPNPTYFASSIMQPILLTPHVDSPFSTDYFTQSSNGVDYTGLFNNGAAYSQNYKHKKPGKRPHHNVANYGYNENNNDGDDNDKLSTTLIHNNVMPVHVSTTNSDENEVLNSYGQSLDLYTPAHEEKPDINSNYGSNSNSNSLYSSNYKNNKYSSHTTKRPSYVSGVSTTSNSYGTTARPFDFHPTANTINQFFTPSEHLGDHNVNKVFPVVDKFGSIPRPIKDKRPNLQIYKPSQEAVNNGDGYNVGNQLFPTLDKQKIYVRPNSQNFESIESNNDDNLNNYQDDNNEEESQLVTYTYGSKKKPTIQQPQFSNYAETGLQSPINSVFSTNNPYMPRPQANAHSSMLSSNSYLSPSKNKYTPINSPISSAYGEGAQFVNVGGNFISFDVFQNSILPIVSGNPSSLNNIEVITCAAGVRQPNITDCTRYYVCSKKDGKVLSYSCPPYTAFNNEARICDARTYAMCSLDAIVPNYSVSENKRIHMETIKTLQEAKRRQSLQHQQQVIKAQNLANLLHQYNSPSSSSFINPITSISSSAQDSSEQNMLSSYMQQSAAMGQTFGTTLRPQLTTSTNKKRKYYCKEGDKIADQTSVNNYFVCYKNAQGQMKGHKMSCSKSLIFCAKTTMCTLPSKCL